MSKYFKNRSKSKRNTVVIEDVPIHSSDDFSNNVIDKDLQSFLRPLNFIHSVFICAKYSIRNNIVTPNNYLYNYVRVSCVIVFRCAFLHNVICHIIDDDGGWGYNRLLISLLCCFDAIIYSFGDMINSISNIVHSHYNILMVLNIQQMLRDLKINGNDLRSSIVCSWTTVIILNILIITFITIFCFVGVEINIFYIISAFGSIIYDINVVYALLVLKLINKILRIWINKVENLHTESPVRDYWDITFDVYLNIQETFVIIETTFQQMILFYTIFSAYLILRNDVLVLNIRKLISVTEYGYVFLPLLCQIWNWKNILVIICLSVECETFYEGMKNVQSTCYMLIHLRNCSAPEKKLCKNILRVQKASFKKMSACGFFTIDGKLPLQLSCLIASYTMVFLQYALL